MPQQFTPACLSLAIICLAFTSVCSAEKPVDFGVDVASILSKSGCNSGACHGNANGKGGFKLSLRSEQLAVDYQAIVEHMSARRINRVSPESSLLLLKATSQVPHQGGKRFAVDSPEYLILRKWIAGNTPGPMPNGPTVESISVKTGSSEANNSDYPLMFVDPNKKTEQIKVTATFSNGEVRDVTNFAIYETTKLIAEVDATGKVRFSNPGKTTVVIRYLGKRVAIGMAMLKANDSFAWSNPNPANEIDSAIYSQLKKLRLNPSEKSTDSVFIRRLFLDVLGILPTPREAQQFVKSQDSQKRSKLIDEILQRPEYAERWALKWCDVLRVEEKVLDPKGVDLFYNWIKQSFADDVPLNTFAAKIIGARGSTYANPPANFWRNNRDPLTRGENTARAFLGVRLQCARCHNHPYDKWTQDEYYQWAETFSDVHYKIVENNRKDKNDKHEFIGEQIVEIIDRKQFAADAKKGLSKDPKPKGKKSKKVKLPPRVKHPLTKKFIDAKILGEENFIPAGNDKLQQLSSWIESKTNDTFARMQSNRIWLHLMGTTLVDPVDDLRSSNPPTNPELMDLLVKKLVETNYSVREVCRLILNSNTYQASSIPSESNFDDQTEFSRAILKRLDAEQLLDAQTSVLDIPVTLGGYQAGTRAGQVRGAKRIRGRGKGKNGDLFLSEFGKPKRLVGCECERTNETNLSQALTLLSDFDLHRRLMDKSNRIHRLAKSEQDNREIINEIYWTALSRPPTQTESEKFSEFIDNHENRISAFEDVTWAILNSKEFMFRH